MTDIFIVVLVAGAIGFAIGFIFYANRLKQEEQNRTILAKQLAGTYSEQLVPWLKNVKYHPKDMHFLGKPVDYFIDVRDENDKCTEVVFLEVKSGNSQMTEREKSLKCAIDKKLVRWEELRI